MESITPPLGAAGSPPERLPTFRGGRPLKRWRYVGVFCEELMACAATVRVGPARQSFWALASRGEGEPMRERTRLLPRRSALELTVGRSANGPAPPAPAGPAAPVAPGRLRVRDAGVALELSLEEEAGVSVRCPHGRGEVWTRKQAGVATHGTLALDGGPAREVRARAVIDDTAGYHARHTEWWWSAGVGTAADGGPLAWNLVCGVNDPPHGSERAVWIAGVPREAPPVGFARDLSSILCEDGSELSFRAEAERARHENLVLVRSSYRAPFGTFSGTLPGGVTLAHGLGVVEHHRAVW
jgi:Domain of unknown function (DUF2804), C-terminal